MDDVYGRRITGNGVQLSETAIAAYANPQHYPSVAANRLNKDTPYLVVYEDFVNDPAGDIHGTLVHKDGTPVHPPIQIATAMGHHEAEPSIAQSEAWENYLVVWVDGQDYDRYVLGMEVGNSGLLNPEFNLSERNFSGSSIIYPDIALGNTAGLAVWMDDYRIPYHWDIVGRLIGYQQRLPLIIYK